MPQKSDYLISTKEILKLGERNESLITFSLSLLKR
jgi:hypothetical protein